MASWATAGRISAHVVAEAFDLNGEIALFVGEEGQGTGKLHAIVGRRRRLIRREDP